MASIRIDIVRGSRAGTTVRCDRDALSVGNGGHNDVVLPEPGVAAEHVRLLPGESGWILEVVATDRPTAVFRAGAEIAAPSDARARVQLADGDELRLGGDDGAALVVHAEAEAGPAHVVARRPIDQLPDAARVQGSQRITAMLLHAHRQLDAAPDLHGVLEAVADAALSLVERATHATLVLRDDADGDDLSAFVPVLTRVRDAAGRASTPDEPVPITRSVFRHVVRERAAILAADAPASGLGSESLLGAQIQSTIGVPLWRADRILGVLQVDNREQPVLFSLADVDALGLLAAQASLAVDNARLIRRLRTAEERLRGENDYLRDRDRQRDGVRIIGESSAIKQLENQIDRVVATRVTVLILGETGTGKELVARALHQRSPRRERLFVAQNCAALPEQLLESELFGHKRGTFTGATEDKKGLFVVADGGSLFLDEIGEMPLSLQAKLLRVLQDGEVRPLGAATPRKVDVRIIAATNRDLEREVAAGRFREDLYYRLNVFPLRLAPLRERREDIPHLARFFLDRTQQEMGKSVAGFAQQTLELMKGWDWPGNVRELENEVQRLVIQADEGQFLAPELLSSRIRRTEVLLERAGARAGTLHELLEQVEKYIIAETLRTHDNNKTAAAKTLGITREGLHKKLRQLGM